MAAATLVGAKAKAGVPTPGSGPGGTLKAAYGTITIDASSEAGDIWEVCKVPAGATVIGGWMTSIDGDTGIEALDIDIGWKANADEILDADGFGNNGVLVGAEFSPTGYHIPFGGVLQTVGPKTFTAETVITLTTVAAAGTGAATETTVVVLYLFNE